MNDFQYYAAIFAASVFLIARLHTFYVRRSGIKKTAAIKNRVRRYATSRVKVSAWDKPEFRRSIR